MFMTVFLGCLVGVVVVAQTLYTSTMEHIKEFGTVKAIGGSNRDIYSILGEQATIAAVVGFVARRRHGLAPAAGDGEDRPQADHLARASPHRRRGHARALPRRRHDLVPQGRAIDPALVFRT